MTYRKVPKATTLVTFGFRSLFLSLLSWGGGGGGHFSGGSPIFRGHLLSWGGLLSEGRLLSGITYFQRVACFRGHRLLSEGRLLSGDHLATFRGSLLSGGLLLSGDHLISEGPYFRGSPTFRGSPKTYTGHRLFGVNKIVTNFKHTHSLYQ